MSPEGLQAQDLLMNILRRSGSDPASFQRSASEIGSIASGAITSIILTLAVNKVRHSGGDLEHEALEVMKMIVANIIAGISHDVAEAITDINVTRPLAPTEETREIATAREGRTIVVATTTPDRGRMH